jgi:DNA sulfur modification protein DndD
VILREVMFDNFRQYKKDVTFYFDEPDPTHPLVLIGGVNTAGKTTFLHGLIFGLLGDAGAQNLLHRGPMARSDINQERLRAGQGTITIRIRFEHVGQRYEITRFWLAEPRVLTGPHDAELKSAATATIDGSVDPELESVADIDAFFQSVLPIAAARFFLFDGERIRDFGNDTTRRKELDRALIDLLGLEPVERLIRDLEAQRKSWIGAPREADPEDDAEIRIEQAKLELKKLDRRLERTREAKAEAGRRLQVLKAEHNELTLKEQELLRLLDPRTGERREQVRAELKRTDDELRRLREADPDYLDATFPLALVRDLVAAVARQGEAERTARPRGSEQAVTEVLQAHGCDAGPAKLTEVARAVVARLFPGAGAEQYLDIPQSELSQIQELLPQLLRPDAEAAVRLSAQTELEERRERLTAEGRSIDAAPDATQARQELAAKIRETAQAVEAEERSMNELESDLTRLKNDRDKQEGSIEALMATAHREKIRAQKSKLAASALNVLRRFRTRKREQMLETVREEAQRLFLEMTGAGNGYARLRMAPDTLQITVITEADDPISSDRLSDGERMMLAYALIGALAKVSDLDLPMVVDAPLHRLDSRHRVRMLQRFAQISPRQAILLTTDEEIRPDQLDALQGVLGSKMTLHRRGAGGTTILRGEYVPGREVDHGG